MVADGRLATAGFDVFDDESPGRDSALLRFDQAVLSPRVADLTLEAAGRTAVSAVQNVLDHSAGRRGGHRLPKPRQGR